MRAAYARTGRGAAIIIDSDSRGALIPEIPFAISLEYGWQDFKTYGQGHATELILRQGGQDHDANRVEGAAPLP